MLRTVLAALDTDASGVCVDRSAATGGPMTRARLGADVRATGAALVALPGPRGGARPGSVWVAVRDPYLAVVAALGALHTGRATLLDPEGPATGFDRMALSCSPAVVVTDTPASAVAQWAGGRGVPVYPVRSGERAPTGAAEPPDDAAISFFTSGSTGTPRCVTVGAAQLSAAVLGVADRVGLTPDDTALTLAPLSHTLGMVTGVLVPLVSGGTIAFADPLRPAEILAAIGRAAPTWCPAAPSTHRMVARVLTGAKAGWPALRLLRGGAALLAGDLQRDLEARYGVPYLNAYAMTQAPGEIASQSPEGPRVPGSVGPPTLCAVRIQGYGDEPVAADGSGEIWVRGPNVVGGDATGWLASGDVGRLDEQGCLHVTGRVDDVINTGGLKVWPPDVETAAQEDPRVGTAVAFPIPHPGLGEAVGLAVVPAPGYEVGEVDGAALRGRLRDLLPRHAWPSTVVVCAEIPRSARGKVQRGTLWRQLPGVPVRAGR